MNQNNYEQAERELHDNVNMTMTIQDSVRRKTMGEEISEETQRELALYQRRQWTERAFRKLVVTLQFLAFLSFLVLFHIFYILGIHYAVYRILVFVVVDILFS